MTLRRIARRLAAAGALAALGLSFEGAAFAQQGVPPGVGSSRPADALPQLVRDAGPPAAPLGSLPMFGAAAPGQPGLIPNAIAPALPPSAGTALVPALPSVGTAPVAAAPCTTCGGAGGDGFDWTKVPVVPVPLPRPGYFVTFPTGPGYYTGLDCLLGNYRDKPPAYPYPRFCINFYPLYDFSFAYLDKPGNTEHDYLDPIKRIHLGDDWLLSFGGEYRYRHISETDYQGNKAGTNNYPNFYRTRLFTDLWYRDLFRVYVEGIDSKVDDFRAPITPGVNDQDHFDLLNAFIDVKIPFLDEGTTRNSYVRVGRQELLYGSQRLVSPSDFANVRVNFQGVSAWSRGEKFDIDAFVVNPVMHALDKFDSVDDKQLFLGAWLTYRPVKGQSVELYYLNLSNANHTFTTNGGASTASAQPGSSAGNISTAPAGATGGYDVNTFGSRYSGNAGNFLFDFEGMFQFGTYVNQTSVAGATVAEVGYNLKDVLPMNAQFWIGYDWASGGSNTNTHHTFNQLFTFGHYYFGQADVVGRQNINDLSAQFTFFPTNWITVNTQFHDFYLDNARDSLYNKGGVATRTSANGSAGTNVGRELDFLVNFHLTNHSDVQFGYSHFFSGDFMARTGSGKDIDFSYVQYTYRF